MNWYAYCGNNSANGADPSGLRWEDPAVRILFYDSEAEGCEDAMNGVANDPYFDIAIDISRAGARAAGYRDDAHRGSLQGECIEGPDNEGDAE